MFVYRGKRIYKAVVGGVSERKMWLLTIHRAKNRDVAASVSKGRVIRDSREE